MNITVATHTGGLSNRIKCIVSCIRLLSKNGGDLKVFWKILDNYNKNHHILNCPFNKLYQNNIEIHNLGDSSVALSDYYFKRLF